MPLIEAPARRPPTIRQTAEGLVTLARLALSLAILVAFQLVGSWIADVLHLPVPGSVVGMILLTAILELEWLPIDAVRPAGDLLLRHLTLLYVPAGAALLLYVGVLRAAWLAVAVAGVASLLAVLIVVGVVTQRLERES